MLTLDAVVKIPPGILFTTVDQDSVLLNTHTNQYYALEQVGARLWVLLVEGNDLRSGYQTILNEFEVPPSELERDLLEFLNDLLANGLVEIVQT